MKEKVADTYFTYKCNKCNASMIRWIKDPISEKWIWICSNCKETERELA